MILPLLFLFSFFCLLPISVHSQELDFVCSQCGENFKNYKAFKNHFILEALEGHGDPENELSYFHRDPMHHLLELEGQLGNCETEGGSSRGSSSRYPNHNENPHHLGHHHLPQNRNPREQILYFNTPTQNQQKEYFKTYCERESGEQPDWVFNFMSWGKEFEANGANWEPSDTKIIVGDGNCLFSAIALALMGKAECGFLLRETMGNSYDIFVAESKKGKEHETHPIRHGNIEDIIAIARFYKEQMHYDPEYPTIPLVLTGHSNNHYNLIKNIQMV